VTRARSHLLAVAALTVVGALLRFPTLDRQSFWLDELVTVSLLDHGLGDVLREVPRTEATPFLYYVVAWAWGSLFGLGEIGIRTLSALAGTATIPVAYGAGAVLVSRRAGIVAAALVAVNPFLVWYSQEARSYALLGLLGAATVLAFGHALRGSGRALVLWGVLCALAIATHYYALFLVGAELVWLLVRARPLRPVILASLIPLAALAVHVPLLLEQRDNGEAVTGSSLAARIAGIPKNLVVGYSFPAEALGSAAAALLLLVGLALLARVAPAERRGALVAGSLAAAVVLIPVVLAVVGEDYLVARNTIVAVVPAAVCLGAGFATGRLGLAAATALCVLSAAIAIAPALDTSYGRTDWRGAAKPLASAAGPRAIVVTPYMSRTLWRPYLPGLREPSQDGATVEEIAAVGLATEGGYSAGHVEPPGVGTPEPLKGFRVVDVERKPTYTLVLYRAEHPTFVRMEKLIGLALTDEQPGVLLQGS
jgi:4-amino-4-deoxy-L-arabinose transferase-like glycosyltransferase